MWNLFQNIIKSVIQAAQTIAKFVKAVSASQPTAPTSVAQAHSNQVSEPSAWQVQQQEIRRQQELRRRREIERKRKEEQQRKKAAQFDRDIEQVRGRAYVDDSDYLRPKLLSFELTKELYSHPSALNRSLTTMMRDQPDVLESFITMAPSHEAGLNAIFARFGWDEEDDEAALKLLRMWLAEQENSFDKANLKQKPALGFECSGADCEVLNEAWIRLLADANSGNNTDQQTINWMYQQFSAAFEGDITNPDALVAAMETVFGYNIEWGSSVAADDITLKTQIAERFLTSNLHIMSYFSELASNAGMPYPTLEANRIMRTLFAEQGLYDQRGAITVHLGADTESEGAYYGKTPQGSEGRYEIYLGSQTSVSTITHELGHQLDRSQNVEFGAGLNVFVAENGQLFVRRNVIRAFAATGEETSTDAQGNVISANDTPYEISADLFMTAVLDGRGFTAEGTPTYAENDTTVGWHIDAFSGEQGTQATAVEALIAQYICQRFYRACFD